MHKADRVPVTSDYPLGSSHELARRLLNRQLVFPDDGHLLQHEIRPLLRKLRCPKTGSTRQARWLIDKEMAERVATELGRPLR
jgi:hypothetical protein